MKQLTFTITLLFASFSLFAQFGSVPERDQADSYYMIIILDGFELPAAGTTDNILAVSADDAFVLLGEGLTGDNGVGTHIAGLYVNNPAPATAFNLIYFDVSTGLYHILLDENGEVLEIDYLLSDIQAGTVAGYEDATGTAGPYPGIGTPDPVGLPLLLDAQVQLPVDFTAFTATKLGKAIGLNWSTATESGNDFYAVERSVDGEVFTEIGRVNGAGESRTSNDYNFTDEAPSPGVNYYRLRQVDFDGAFSFSNVVFVQNDASEVVASKVFPNPASGQTVVNVSGNWVSERVSATLLDANGRVLREWKQVTNSSETIYLTALASGVYQLLLTDGTNQQVQRLVIR
jgi:hypothetical protein